MIPSNMEEVGMGRSSMAVCFFHGGRPALIRNAMVTDRNADYLDRVRSATRPAVNPICTPSTGTSRALFCTHPPMRGMAGT